MLLAWTQVQVGTSTEKQAGLLGLENCNQPSKGCAQPTGSKARRMEGADHLAMRAAEAFEAGQKAVCISRSAPVVPGER